MIPHTSTLRATSIAIPLATERRLYLMIYKALLSISKVKKCGNKKDLKKVHLYCNWSTP